MKILLVKSVFCPNIGYLNDTVKSLIKVNMFICLIKKKYDITVDLYLIGWINKFKKHMNLSLAIHKLSFDSIDKEFWPLNYGKYKIYNCLIDYLNKNNNDFTVYLDHDIHFEINLEAVDKFMSICSLKDTTINGKNLGIIALNQKGDVRHQGEIYENNHQTDNMTLVWSNINGSIASGAFVIFPNIFLKLDYFKLLSVYGLDDYYLTKQLSDKGYLNVVINDIYVYHPFSKTESKEYKKWKKENIEKMINGTMTSYYKNIEESLSIEY